MKMSRLVVTTLSLQTCVFIFSVFAAGDIASHTGVFRGPSISSLVGREEILAGELLSGVVFRDFRRYKSYHFLKLIRGQV